LLTSKSLTKEILL